MNFLTGVSNMSLDNLLQVSNKILGKRGEREARVILYFKNIEKTQNKLLDVEV